MKPVSRVGIGNTRRGKSVLAGFPMVSGQLPPSGKAVT